MNKLITIAIFSLTGLIGLAAMAFPFLQSNIDLKIGAFTISPGNDPINQPLLTGLILAICVVVLLVDLQGKSADAKVVASLGVLVAMASVLRLLETAIPGPAGFSPIFVPIILAGYVFGPRYGFLMGALTLLTSALMTAGLGPWLPFQMLVAGWIGLTAGLLPRSADPKKEVLVLLLFGFLWGLLYGLFLNLFLWPFVTGESALIISSGVNLASNVSRYMAFYVTTSLLWDLARGLGNALLILAIGLPVVRIMSRFKDKISFQVA